MRITALLLLLGVLAGSAAPASARSPVATGVPVATGAPVATGVPVATSAATGAPAATGAAVRTGTPVATGAPVARPGGAAANPSPVSGPAGPSPPSPASAPEPGRSFVLPVPPPPVVLTPFQPPEHRYGTGHRGVDLAAPAGSPVRAAAAGTVVYAGVLAGRGVVSLQHPGGLRTTYEPVDATVAAGRAVTAGTVVGVLQPGHGSCSPADCLHWGARLPDGSYLDPMSLLSPWRVRLKPWDDP